MGNSPWVAQLDNRELMTTDTQRFPEIPKSLIDELERRFPNKIPTSETISESSLRILQGQQQVLALLRHQFDLQNRTVLENE